MRLAASITAFAFVTAALAPPAIAQEEQETVELSREEARACEVCVDRYDELKSEATDLEAKYNRLAGQLRESRQTVRVQQQQLRYQGRDIGRLTAESNQKVPKWAFIVPTTIATLLVAGWTVDKFSN